MVSAGASDNPATQGFADSLASAIVAEITNFAVVDVDVVSVSGVTTGAGVSGPGTGTGTIS
jgi:hypothetical protein